MSRFKFQCFFCGQTNRSALKIREHLLFTHGFLMPQCNTGLSEKQFEHDTSLRKEYLNTKNDLRDMINKTLFYYFKKYYSREYSSVKQFVELRLDKFLYNRGTFKNDYILCDIPKEILNKYLQLKRNWIQIKSEIDMAGLIVN